LTAAAATAVQPAAVIVAPATPNFRALLGEAAWADLPPRVRARFDAAAHRAPRSYPGVMDVRLSALGWLFAQLCRPIGTPLAPWNGAGVPVVVHVRSEAGGGIVWERVYARPRRRPLVIASRKLAVDGGLMEVTRGGLGMRLALSVETGALVFRSTAYVWRLGPWLVPVPDVLTPGAATVSHRDLGDGRFTFSLSFVHPWAGETVFNAGVFEDPPP